MIQTEEEEEEKKNTSNSIPYWSQFISTYSNLSQPQRFGKYFEYFYYLGATEKKKNI